MSCTESGSRQFSAARLRFRAYAALMTTHSEREITATKLIQAGRPTVFRAWTDPDLLARWWGPKGFSSTFQEFEPKAGGNWRFVMHGPDGKAYQNESRFGEVTEPERIVLEHVSQPHFQIAVQFEALSAGVTKLTWRMVFDSAEELAEARDCADTASEENLDRLADLLAS